LRAILENPEVKLTRAFVHNLIHIWHNKYEHNSNIEPYKLCYFDKEFLKLLESKIGIRINFSRIYSGHDNILFASELLSWLTKEGISFRDHILTIQVLSNIFEVGLSQKSEIATR